MDCNQQQTTVAVTKTLYENFLEEKCESDLLIPDYYPAAEKIIQCSAAPVITRKEVEGDRLTLEGSCRLCVIYQGEEGDIKSLSESISFGESFPLKESGNDPWAQVIVRVAGTSCRLLNPRKISCRATVSIALKVKDQQMTETIEQMNCEEAEALFVPASVYTVLEHTADTTKVQGEIEVPNDIQDILKTEGSVTVKDIKLMPGKAVLKGVADLFVLYTAESDPTQVESTSTAIPFSQILELQQGEEGAQMDASAVIQNLRTDVESDDAGKNRIISITATVLTEGEVFENQEHRMLTDTYSNRYPLETEIGQVTVEEMTEHLEGNETLRHTLPADGEEITVVQAIGTPVIQKITGQDKTLSLDGVLDVSVFIREGDHYRSIEKALPFTVKRELKQLSGHMRCEVRPFVLGMDWNSGKDQIELKTELGYGMTVFSREAMEVITGVEVDIDHPLEPVQTAPLVVYYGEKGERLWDIARRYSTSVSAIKTVNELSRDVLDEKRLLLISR